MIDSEPKIKVALLQKCPESRMKLEGIFFLPDNRAITGKLSARAENGQIVLADSDGREVIRQKEICLNPGASSDAFFSVGNVKIGIDFHWERTQEQSFRGALLLSMSGQNDFHLINVVPLEDYLASVISSEMSAEAPLEFLKTQAVTARSWLIAMLAKKKAPRQTPPAMNDKHEIILWQDVNDHEGFDVCADDHCQRYQGITRIISENVARAIDATRGLFLLYDGEVCDARYYKCCGGRTEIFSSAWENRSPAYLQSITDSDREHPPIQSEKDAADWLTSRPPAYCNTADAELLGRILPAFDRETTHFYRWQTAYSREELEIILCKKSGLDFGNLQHIIPLERGPSGRIRRLQIIGSKRTVIVGKELEIRRWLSESHLLSSAFIVAVEHDPDGWIKRFIFHGGGWGHGVGLCQIGAAVMASQGYPAEKILTHYFRGAVLKILY